MYSDSDDDDNGFTFNHPLLNRDDYLEWSRHAQSYLMIEGFWMFVKGPVAKSSDMEETSREEDRYAERRTRQPSGHILFIIDSSQSRHLDGIRDPVAMWEKLKLVNAPRPDQRFLTLRDILLIRQDEDEGELLGDMTTRAENLGYRLRRLLPKRNSAGNPFTLDDFIEELTLQSILYSPSMPTDTALRFTLWQKTSVRDVREAVVRSETWEGSRGQI